MSGRSETEDGRMLVRYPVMILYSRFEVAVAVVADGAAMVVMSMEAVVDVR